jgi:enamine deaminase RidA (YjgF/YER057c/UK114 family)
MTSVELIRSTSLTDTAPYAYASVVAPGRLVFTAGACPLDDDGAVVAPGDVAKTTVYVASSSRDDLVAAWGVVRDAFGDHDVPSTLLGVAVLGCPDQLVEVEAVAVAQAG